MREIKFRGKDIDCNEWRYGSLVKIRDERLHKNDGYLLYYIVDEENQQWIALPETVGQYTGLKDKNGKEIFEGDIVFAIATYDCANTVVVWDDGGFVLVPCKYYKNYISRCGYKDIRFLDKEVVGNIHDSPELLEVV